MSDNMMAESEAAKKAEWLKTNEFPPKPEDIERFWQVFHSLRAWRESDQEDSIGLSRNEVCRLVDGIRDLQRMNDFYWFTLAEIAAIAVGQQKGTTEGPYLDVFARIERLATKVIRP